MNGKRRQPGVVAGTAVGSQIKLTEPPVSFDAANGGIYYTRTEYDSKQPRREPSWSTPKRAKTRSTGST